MSKKHERRSEKLKTLLIERVTDEDLEAIVSGLIEKAKGGNVDAARELLNRLMGKPSLAKKPEGPRNLPPLKF